MSVYTYADVNFPLGRIFVIARDSAVVRVVFGESEFDKTASRLGGVSAGGYAESAARSIRYYLDGKLTDFDLNLDFSRATGFQVSVWRELLKIPYGATRTYREVAESIGNPRAQRAVGGAAGANPIAIIVPCHRVLAAGGLGGYSCGIEIKKKLLAIEGAM